MARFEHLPVYTQSYGLTKACFRALEQMPRGHKSIIGDRLVQSALRQTQLIVFANGSTHKMKPLDALILEIENMTLLLRVAVDVQAISEKHSKILSQRLFDIRKQTQSWRTWAKENINPQRNDSHGKGRGGNVAESQMSQGSRTLRERSEAGSWEPKPDPRKRGV